MKNGIQNINVSISSIKEINDEIKQVIIKYINDKYLIANKINSIIEQYYIDKNLDKDYEITYSFNEDSIDFNFEELNNCSRAISIFMQNSRLDFYHNNEIISVDINNEKLKETVLIYLINPDAFEEYVYSNNLNI